MKYSLKDFRENAEHVIALQQFLSTDAGIALQTAMRNESPSRKLGRNFASLSAGEQRAVGVAETGSSESLLGHVEGFEGALALLFEEALDPIKHREKASRKGGRTISPEPAPQS